MLYNRSQYMSVMNSVSTALDKALQVPTQSEPQLVANMVYYIPNEINSAGLTSVSSGGIFIHGQPQVKCGNFPSPAPKSVEIGDLLLIRTEVDREGITSRAALLLQAKKFDSIPIKPDNENQLFLYSDAPRFTYTTPKRLYSHQRHLTGPDLYNATKYLLIGKRHYHDTLCYPSCCHHCCIGTCVLTAQPTSPRLSYYRCFVIELADFIFGNAGKSYRKPCRGEKNWNRVIHDLTTVTASQASVYVSRATGGSSNNRGQGLYFIAGDFKSPYAEFHKLGGNRGKEPPDVPDEWITDVGDFAGVSVIEFVVTHERG